MYFFISIIIFVWLAILIHFSYVKQSKPPSTLELSRIELVLIKLVLDTNTFRKTWSSNVICFYLRRTEFFWIWKAKHFIYTLYKFSLRSIILIWLIFISLSSVQYLKKSSSPISCLLSNRTCVKNIPFKHKLVLQKASVLFPHYL